jgi:integrase
VAPTQVDNTHLEVFRSVLTNDAIHRAPDRAVDQLGKSWNECATNIPGWPGKPLNSSPRRIPYVIKEALLPEGLRHQIDEHFQRLEKPAIFPNASIPSTTASPFAPSARGIASTTVERQRYRLRQYLSALGMQPHEMTDLAKLVKPNLVEQGLMFFYERAGQRVSSQLELIALVLIGIAERYLNDEETGKRIREMLKNARTRRRPPEMSAKVRERLRQFDDHRNLMSFLNLPARLVKLAQATKSTCPIRAARLFECAFVIEFMTNCPIRIGNVAALDIDKHFCKSHPGPKGIVHLGIPPEEAKNRRAIEFEVPSTVMRLFKTYIEEFRPHIPGSDSRWLFPQADGKQVNSKSLGTRISRAILRYTGIKMHCHMFRHFAGERMEATPGGHGLVPHLLGHTSSATSERFYIRRNMDKAIKHYADTILKARQGTVL